MKKFIFLVLMILIVLMIPKHSFSQVKLFISGIGAQFIPHQPEIRLRLLSPEFVKYELSVGLDYLKENDRKTTDILVGAGVIKYFAQDEMFDPFAGFRGGISIIKESYINSKDESETDIVLFLSVSFGVDYCIENKITFTTEAGIRLNFGDDKFNLGLNPAFLIYYYF